MSALSAWAAWSCVGGLIVTAIVHTVLGERLLIGPLLRRRRDRILEVPLARFVLRFGWHMMSIAFLVLAAVLALLIPGSLTIYTPAFLITGAVFTAVGLIDAVASRGRHVGWPLLFATGIAGLVAGSA